MRAKSTREKPRHAACLLTKQFNPQMYDFSVKFVILASANRYIFSFSFFFLFKFSKPYSRSQGRKKEEIKKRKKIFCPTRTRTQDLSVLRRIRYLLSYIDRCRGRIVFWRVSFNSSPLGYWYIGLSNSLYRPSTSSQICPHESSPITYKVNASASKIYVQK